MMWRVSLQALVGGSSSFSFGLDPAVSEVSLGRSRKRAQLVVDEAFPATSRVHCVFKRSDDGGSVRIVDQDSMNGTFVNRTRIKSASLKIGDSIIVGSCEAASTAFGATLDDELPIAGKSAEFKVVGLSSAAPGAV
eukprot:COSAG06_NODE_21816_length_744_cov_1.213953_1_plen_135_part_10